MKLHQIIDKEYPHNKHYEITDMDYLQEYEYKFQYQRNEDSNYY